MCGVCEGEGERWSGACPCIKCFYGVSFGCSSPRRLTLREAVIESGVSELNLWECVRIVQVEEGQVREGPISKIVADAEAGRSCCILQAVF